MRALLAVTSLELERRWLLLPLAVALGVCPFVLVPLLQMGSSDTQLLGLLFSLTIAGLAALILGASVIAGDLAAGRLSFLFARPLPWWTIWGGKMLAAALLTFLAGLLALIPSLAFRRGGPLSFASLWDAQGAVYLAGLALLVLGTAHLGALALRARTWWLALDLGLLALVAWSVERLASRMLELALWPDAWGFPLLIWPLASSVHLAGAAQVASGRTGAERSHRVASLTLWPLLLAILVCWQVIVERLAHPSLEALDRAWIISPSSRGSRGWIAGSVDGPGFRLSRVTFLVDAASGRAVRLRAPTRAFVSPDGSRAAWIEYEGGRRTGTPTLVAARFDDLGAEPARTPLPALPAPSWIRAVATTTAGTRVAILQGERAYFFETAEARLERTLDARDGGRVEHVLFTDERHALAYRADAEGGLTVERLALPAGPGETVGRVPPPAPGESWKVLHFEASGARLLALRSSPGAAAQLVDARSGQPIARFDLPAFAGADGTFLADGRLLLAEAGARASRLRLIDPGSGERETLELPGAGQVNVVETVPGRVLVSFGNFPAGRSGVLVVSTDPLRVVRTDRGMWRRPGLGPGLRVEHDRPIGGQLLLQTDAIGVVLYDVDTGRTTHVAGPRLAEAAPQNGS